MCAARMYIACHYMRAAHMWEAHNLQIRAAHKQATYMRHTCSTRTTAITVALILHSSHAYVQHTPCSTQAAQMLNKINARYVQDISKRVLLICAAHIAFL